MEININNSSDGSKTTMSIPFLVGRSSYAYQKKTGALAVDYVVSHDLESFFETDEFDVCFDGNTFTFDAIKMIHKNGAREEIGRVQYEVALSDVEKNKFWKVCARDGYSKDSDRIVEPISEYAGELR